MKSRTFHQQLPYKAPKYQDSLVLSILAKKCISVLFPICFYIFHFSLLKDSFSSLAYCWWAWVTLSLPHNYRYSNNRSLMCSTCLTWLVHCKPIMGKFQSFLLHIWSCRGLASTLNVLISLSLPSLVSVRPNLAFCWKQQASACTTKLEMWRGADGISEAVFDNLSLHICPSTHEA